MRFPLAKGSFSILFGLAILSLIAFQSHPYAGWPVFLFFLFSITFFRDPEREVPPGPPSLAVCAADGQVISIGEVYEGSYLKGPCLRIAIFMSVFDVHVNRMPVAGEIEYVAHRPGAFKVAWVDKASEDNERNDVGIRFGDHKVMCRQIAGLVARRIVCHVKVGDRLGKGERYGLIRYGSRMEIFLPLGSEALVEVGQQVYGTLTAIARLPEGSP
jgi:phosphatidylserine decarboxylase